MGANMAVPGWVDELNTWGSVAANGIVIGGVLGAAYKAVKNPLEPSRPPNASAWDGVTYPLMV